MTEHLIKTKSEHRSIFINIHLHAKSNGRVCEKSTSKCVLSFAVQREHEVETLTLSPHTVFKTPCKVKLSRSIARGNSSSQITTSGNITELCNKRILGQGLHGSKILLKGKNQRQGRASVIQLLPKEINSYKIVLSHIFL